MSRHEGVSCDSCLKSNFSGKRYKCLICFDYDLCADCYEEGATSTRHSTDHPMQCLLTRTDMDMYFGGEMLNSEQPQSYTCPYCKKMGFSDASLIEHVGAEHTDTGLEVVCPVCAGLPGGEPNLVTDDFAGHLTLEHRTGPRDLISFLDEPSAIRHGGVRRIPGRALGGTRSRRSNMHFSSSALSPSGRESVDPIAELLSQLSGVRRGAPQPSQLQQLQMQIQLERQQVSATRQQLERLPRRQAHPVVSSSNSNAPMQEAMTSGSGTGGTGVSNGASGLNASGAGGFSLVSSSSSQQPQTSMAVTSINTREISINSSSLPLAVTSMGLGGAQGSTSSDCQSQFLLSKFMTPTLDENELAQLERDRADRSQYVQALMLSTLSNIQLQSEFDNQERGESQETNSDTVNSEANNESGDDTSNTKDKEGKKRKSDNSLTGAAAAQLNEQSSNTLGTFEDEFVDEYTLQQQQQQQHSQNFTSSVIKKKIACGGVAGKSNANSTQDRRGRFSAAGGGGGGGGGVGGGGASLTTAQQPPQGQQQSKITREIKSASMSSKEIPDSR